MYFDVKYEKIKRNWKRFEDETAKIFENFDYEISRDVRFKTNRRFQIDFIAYDKNRRFFVDCKDHLYIPPKKEDQFANMQSIRAENFIDKERLLDGKKNFILLVTRNKTNSLILHNPGNGKILSVDYLSLPLLLRDINKYEDELLSLE